MKKTSLKRLAIIFSLICCSAAVAWACGFQVAFSTYWFSSKLSPETFVNENERSLIAPSYDTYRAFPFYSFTQNGEYVGFDTRDLNVFIQDSVRSDWQAYLGSEIDYNTINTVLFSSNTSIGAELCDYLEGKSDSLPEELSANKIDAYRSNDKFQNFAEFIALSKQAEDAFTGRNYSWDGQNNTYTISGEIDLFEQAKKLYKRSKDAFIKQRAWFLVVRLYFYSIDAKDMCIEFFDDTQASRPKDLLYYRALSYKAGVYYHKKDFIRSNYYYAQVYDNCPLLVRVSSYSYHPLDDAELADCLALANRKEDKISILTLQGLYTDEQKMITEILKIDPQNEHINLLLSRMMTNVQNQLGATFRSPVTSQAPDYFYEYTTDEQADSVRNVIINSNLPFIAEVCKNYENIDKYTWYTSLGYMQAANNMHELAIESYQTALVNAPKGSETYANQLRILKLHNRLETCHEIDELNDPNIIKDLNWLFELKTKDYNEDSNIDNSLEIYGNRTWALTLISEVYNKAGHPIKLNNEGAPRILNDSFYDSKANLNYLANLIEKEDKTPIEEFIVNAQLNTQVEDVYMYLSSLAIWKGNIADAKKYYEATKGKYTFRSNPFNGYLKEDFDVINEVNKKYSYDQFFKTMDELNTKIKNKEDTYNSALLMANAYYNISIYGACRYHPWLGRKTYNLNETTAQLSTSMDQAEYYYKMAYDTATNDEQRAECTFMQAKCERNELYNINFYLPSQKNYMYETDRNSYTVTKNMEAFKTLNEKYSDTQYYQEVIKECGYFTSYVELHP